MAKDRIRRGFEFLTKEGKFWKGLKEGYGVVVFPMGTLGYRAYDCPYDWATEEGQISLRQNLAGADLTFEGRAWLVTRENNQLIWRTKEQLKELEDKQAAASRLEQKRPGLSAGTRLEVYG